MKRLEDEIAALRQRESEAAARVEREAKQQHAQHQDERARALKTQVMPAFF
jgi:uncharacterized protein YdaU (DUF1376 family)